MNLPGFGCACQNRAMACIAGDLAHILVFHPCRPTRSQPRSPPAHNPIVPQASCTMCTWACWPCSAPTPSTFSPASTASRVGSRYVMLCCLSSPLSVIRARYSRRLQCALPQRKLCPRSSIVPSSITRPCHGVTVVNGKLSEFPQCGNFTGEATTSCL